jgi:acetyltransferase-like isoleucine patch superfamily enzyme
VFEASHPFLFFDYLRVPYQVRPLPNRDTAGLPVHQLRAVGQSPCLLWPADDASPAGHRAAGRFARYQLRDCTFFGDVVPGSAPGMLGQFGQHWEPLEPIFDANSRHVASVWRDTQGSIYLPFDPGEVMRRFWSESYQALGGSPVVDGARSAAVRGYYLARPVLPRPVQLWLRRQFTHVQARSSFPAWPVEDTLHNLYAWLLSLAAELAGRPVPFLDPWPDGRTWALVLTHDVETAAGYQDIELLRWVERERGYRSSWNFVGERYRVDDARLQELRDEGCEVGVHGLRHDGRDLASARQMERRLPAMREFAERWGAVGFRSPATQRKWELMPRLGFGYDSSYSDTDPYEPQPGGCCTYWPYFNQTMIELPMTLTQDHTLFFILQNAGPEVWLEKARHLRQRQGMALLVTHPDYAHDRRVTDGYRRLLDTCQCDETVWRALPCEVAAWWRQRDASTIRRVGDAWRVAGPAAERARVRLAHPGTLAAAEAGLPMRAEVSSPVPIVQPTADVDETAVLGGRTTVWQLAQIRETACLGRDCIVGRGAYVGPGVIIGDKVKLQNYALIYEPARLEDGVFIGPAAVLTNDQFPRSVDVGGNLKRPGDWAARGVVVREGASVGARAVILPGCVVGRWAMIAAGAVVTRDVPDFALYVGVPARRVGWVGHAGLRLIEMSAGVWRCPRTGDLYAESAGILGGRMTLELPP